LARTLVLRDNREVELRVGESAEGIPILRHTVSGVELAVVPRSSSERALRAPAAATLPRCAGGEPSRSPKAQPRRGCRTRSARRRAAPRAAQPRAPGATRLEPKPSRRASSSGPSSS
jgi:hypothetical protein